MATARCKVAEQQSLQRDSRTPELRKTRYFWVQTVSVYHTVSKCEFGKRFTRLWARKKNSQYRTRILRIVHTGLNELKEKRKEERKKNWRQFFTSCRRIATEKNYHRLINTYTNKYISIVLNLSDLFIKRRSFWLSPQRCFHRARWEKEMRCSWAAWAQPEGKQTFVCAFLCACLCFFFSLFTWEIQLDVIDVAVQRERYGLCGRVGVWGGGTSWSWRRFEWWR